MAEPKPNTSQRSILDEVLELDPDHYEPEDEAISP